MLECVAILLVISAVDTQNRFCSAFSPTCLCEREGSLNSPGTAEHQELLCGQHRCCTEESQERGLVRRGIRLGRVQSGAGKQVRKCGLGWAERKRRCPELNLLCEKTVPIHPEHCTFLSLKVMTYCCNATVRSAGMCDINRLLNNQFCKRGKVKLHLIL